MIDQNKFKEDITEKFGSLTRFARTTDIQVLDIYKVLQLKDSIYKETELKKYQQLAQSIDAKLLKDDWPDGLGMKIRLAIIGHYNTILNFSNVYPKYANSWLSIVVKNKRKTITPKIKELCNLLNVDYVTE